METTKIYRKQIVYYSNATDTTYNESNAEMNKRVLFTFLTDLRLRYFKNERFTL